MVRPQQARRQHRRIPQKRLIVFTCGIILLIAGVTIGVLNIQGIVQGSWSTIISLLFLPALGIALSLSAWLFPFPASPSRASQLPIASELVRGSFRMGDNVAANFPYITKPIQENYHISMQTLHDIRSSIPIGKRGILILGEANAGKTRLAFEVVTQALPDWPVLRWGPDYALEMPLVESALRCKRLVLLIDDLQDFVPLYITDSRISSVTTVRSLLEILIQNVQHIAIVTTCRLEDETRTRAALGQLFTELTVVTLPHFSPDLHNPKVAEIVAEFQKHGSTQVDDWDGTLGSLVLGLSRKRDEYLNIWQEPAGTVLHAMKLLTRAQTMEHTERRLRALCADIFGDKTLLTDEKLWQGVVSQLVQEQFVTEEISENNRETMLAIRKDTYFDQVITNYPERNRPYQLIRDIARLHDVFVQLKDVDALVNLGTALIALQEDGSIQEGESSFIDGLSVLYTDTLTASALTAYEAALAAFEQAIRIDPTYTFAYFLRGDVLARLKRNEEALAAYEQATRLEPNFSHAFAAKAGVLEQLGRKEEAFEALDQATRLNAESSNTMIEKMMKKIKKKAAISNPVSLYHLVRSALLLQQERFEEAAIGFEEVARLEPSSSLGYLSKAATLAVANRFEEAVIVCEQAISSYPNFFQAYIFKAAMLTELRRDEEALTTIDQIIRIKPDLPDTYFHKARMLTDLKRDEEALDALEQTIRLKPDYAEAYGRKGAVLTALQRYEEAFDAYEQALRLDPNDPHIFYSKHKLLLKLKRYEEALITLAQAIRLDPKSPLLYIDEGDELSSLKRHEEALKAYEQAIRLSSKTAILYLKKGNELASLKRHDEALIAYDLAIQLSPNTYFSSLAFSVKGDFLITLKRDKEAAKTYKQAIDFWPANPSAGKMLVFLKRYEEGSTHCL